MLAQLPDCNAFFNRMMELDASIVSKVNCVLRFANGKVFYLKCGAQDDVWKLYMRNSIDGNEIFLHIEDGVHYPAMMIIHGITDPWCEPWQSTKFAARVQAASASNKPVLLRIDYEAGHGAGSTKMQRFQERADIFTFMMWQFGMEDEESKQTQ